MFKPWAWLFLPFHSWAFTPSVPTPAGNSVTPTHTVQLHTHVAFTHFPTSSFSVRKSLYMLTTSKESSLLFTWNVALFHIKCSLSTVMLRYHLVLKVTQKQSMHWSLGRIPPSLKEAGLWHDVKDEEGGGGAGGGREREKKIWQIHKAVWLHCGHVAAFTTTVCTNLTSLLSSLRLSVFWRELPCFDPI